MRDFDTSADWADTHTLNDLHLTQFDESALSALTQDISRDAFHGGATAEGAPWMLSYETQFDTSPGYDFNAGDFDIDSGGAFTTTAPDVNLEGFGSGFDSTWLDWDTSGWGTEDWSGGWEVSSFDDWDYGDWYLPLILDLNNDGVDITSRTDSTVYFDVDADGYKERTAWAGPSDGPLVIDLAANGGTTPDGQVTQAREFAFALATADPNDSDVEALKTLYDSNGDGLLTAADARFAHFRIWKDIDQDGVSDSGELTTLAANGITSIGLATDGKRLFLPDGTRIDGFGSFTMSGAARTFADVGLAYDEIGFKRVAQSYASTMSTSRATRRCSAIRN